MVVLCPYDRHALLACPGAEDGLDLDRRQLLSRALVFLLLGELHGNHLSAVERKSRNGLEPDHLNRVEEVLSDGLVRVLHEPSGGAARLQILHVVSSGAHEETSGVLLYDDGSGALNPRPFLPLLPQPGHEEPVLLMQLPVHPCSNLGLLLLLHGRHVLDVYPLGETFESRSLGVGQSSSDGSRLGHDADEAGCVTRGHHVTVRGAGGGDEGYGGEHHGLY
mmetsp:Transcript_8067/g.16113  ORF Transcript_8067/g.16113 Transcript_8067/m.16113 type:complete len:221 (+) Transcript_8067:558-1220(+)